MRLSRGAVLAALPGVAAAAAAVAGLVPRLRDLPTYFAPLRGYLGVAAAAGHGLLWTDRVGCGEPLFANPQLALLYPPAWWGLAAPPAVAVGLEVGVHLVLLGLGVFVLVRRLGGSVGWSVAGAWGVVLAGPVVSAAGVLNNLDTLAWMPWLWWGALAGSVPAVAVFTALAWLGAEPQLALLGALIAVTLAPRLKTVAGVALGGGLVAVQLLPFLSWVAGGDRTAATAAEALAAGGLVPSALISLVFPPSAGALPAASFVEAPTLPLWVAILAGVALLRGSPAVRRLALWGAGLVAVAAIAGTGPGAALWKSLTGSLLYYPSRLLFPAAVALGSAAAAAGPAPSSAWRRAAVAGAALAVIGVASGSAPVATLVQAAGAGLALAGPVPAAAAVVAAAARTAEDVRLLKLAPAPGRAASPCASAQSDGRVFTVEPSRDQLAWVGADPDRRAVALGYGYTPLLGDRTMVRTFAPVRSRALAGHLAEADRGPAGRWWLDALGARRVVAQHDLPAFAELCDDDGLHVGANPRGWPLAQVVGAAPEPGRAPVAAGEILEESGRDETRWWRVRVGEEGGLLLLASTPDPGWRFTVDGVRAAVVAGPGILHGVAVPEGVHMVEARYRPVGSSVGAAVSAVAVLLLMVATVRSRSPGAVPVAAPREGPDRTA